ncbi:hypothetical protein [Ensifer sp. ENS08]|uniref:hypothetical protein n=1 Tax=Ensifer sp. ENS08 TaxID=2769273 RepID=UPI00072A2A74|nr:hypothetical protein [Ensifer sp. ENS08]KSV65718.1 hypothetical protein N182_08240 [Sinorhizobium sp. GL2]MBD9568553.1 hypothetical protein [Ensifer sp. ENS08]
MTFLAIRSLELEIGYPVLAVLQALGAALEREGFASRLKGRPHRQEKEASGGR